MIPVSVTGKEGATAHTLARFKLTQFVMTGGSFNSLCTLSVQVTSAVFVVMFQCWVPADFE
jgi:hypothetical protein